MNAAQTDFVEGRRRAINYRATQLAEDMESEARRLHEAADRMADLGRQLVECRSTADVTYKGYGSWAGNSIEQLARPIARDLEQLQRDAARLNGLEDILAHMVKLLEIGD